MKKKYIFVFIPLIILISCNENRTYLTKDEKNWNPYSKGQKLVFETRTGVLDSIFVEDIKFTFPDGIGVINKNEILTVIGRNKSENNQELSSLIFKIYAGNLKRGSRIKFHVSIKDSKLYSNFTDYYDIENYLMKLPEKKISVIKGSFDDVIKIKSIGNYSNYPNAIEFIYWSKSKGYIRFDEYNGTIWELKEISR